MSNSLQTNQIPMLINEQYSNKVIKFMNKYLVFYYVIKNIFRERNKIYIKINLKLYYIDCYWDNQSI